MRLAARTRLSFGPISFKNRSKEAAVDATLSWDMKYVKPACHSCQEGTPAGYHARPAGARTDRASRGPAPAPRFGRRWPSASARGRSARTAQPVADQLHVLPGRALE